MKIYNTKSKKTEVFKPLKAEQVNMYVCGPTVYATPHIGNARSCVIYDLLFRVLKANFKKVNYVRNITDVDDKINAAAKAKNISIEQLTQTTIQEFNQSMASLNVLAPTQEPKVTDNIPQIITTIEQLIANNHAYESQGHVLFDVNSYKDYGKLSGRNIEQMQAGSRVEVASYKKHPMDFVLWKPSLEADDASSKFSSPWGTGRPGWHIECTAMSTDILGETYDIHGGGLDLMFPHHENEIAQGCCANKGSNYANYWVHNGFLTVNGEKMSKSLGNFTTIHDLLKKGIKGEVIRLALLNGHYRKPLDWNDKLLTDSKKTLDNWYQIAKDLKDVKPELSEQINEALCDDLNFSVVQAKLNNLAKQANKGDAASVKELVCNLKYLGFLQDTDWFGADNNEEIYLLIQKRKEAKANKDFALADQIRDDLKAMGIELLDKPDGTTDWRKL